MNPKTFIIILTLIVLAFIARGIFIINSIQNILLDELAFDKLEDFKMFLYLSGVLAIVTTIPFLKKRKNKKEIEKIKLIKKRGIKEAQGI
jgi:amino acid transporter